MHVLGLLEEARSEVGQCIWTQSTSALTAVPLCYQNNCGLLFFLLTYMYSGSEFDKHTLMAQTNAWFRLLWEIYVVTYDITGKSF